MICPTSSEKIDPNEKVSPTKAVLPPLSLLMLPGSHGPYVEPLHRTGEVHPGYIVDSDSMEEDNDEDSIDYPNEPEDDDEDPNEDDEEDLEEDLSEEHEPEDEDAKEEEPSEGSDETESFKEDETAVTPPPPGHRGARISFRPQTLMAASTQTLINAFAAGSPLFPLPPTNPTYDQALLAESSAAAARPPRGRAADKAEDVGYVRSLQASEHMMMTSIEEVNLRVSYQAQVRRKESEDFYTQLRDRFALK
ncbi:hypothetical protein Tco_0906412 [Tanacetum coccineum]|uniref:Uncharacterized protein n=1 Tax=Tanacetum coccineum TaxID=301880 RepID=A0ABQ5CHW6_9ASTR